MGIEESAHWTMHQSSNGTRPGVCNVPGQSAMAAAWGQREGREERRSPPSALPAYVCPWHPSVGGCWHCAGPTGGGMRQHPGGPTRLLGNDGVPLSIWTKLNKGYALSLLRWTWTNNPQESSAPKVGVLTQVAVVGALFLVAAVSQSCPQRCKCNEHNHAVG